MSKKKQNKPNRADKVKDPLATYKGRIRVFSSFEEANEADAFEMAQYTPEQHLIHATDLIQRIFPEELKEDMDKKIYFKQ